MLYSIVFRQAASVGAAQHRQPAVRPLPTIRHAQRGFALVISLLLLVAITLVAITTLRGTTLQERMAANLVDRELAKQLAEAAIVQHSAQLPVLKAGDAGYKHDLPTPTLDKEEPWVDPATAWLSIDVTIDGKQYPVNVFVENLGFWPNRNQPYCDANDQVCMRRTFRITARVPESDGRATVMLQAIWRI